MPTYTLSALTIFLMLLLGAYVVYQTRRSRESEMAIKLRKCEIALQDTEHALQNTLDFYKEEMARMQAKLSGEARPGDDGDRKFRQAKSTFARLYHPDRLQGDTAETQMRTEMFKEFWKELQRIESDR